MFRKLIGGWSTRKQKEEAEDFLRRIRVADGSELGLTVALVLNVAEMCRRQFGWDLFEPASVIATDFGAIQKLSGMAVETQKDGNLAVASALIIWTHSLRGIENLEVRPEAREIWRHLARGFPFAEEGAQMLFEANGVETDLTSLGRFPTGLSPEVQ